MLYKADYKIDKGNIILVSNILKTSFDNVKKYNYILYCYTVEHG